MPSFETHVGLTLNWDPAAQRVTLVGENVKLLYPIFGEDYDTIGAKAVYDQVVAHYQQRKAAFDDDEQKGRQGLDRTEGTVAFVPRKWRGKP